MFVLYSSPLLNRQSGVPVKKRIAGGGLSCLSAFRFYARGATARSAKRVLAIVILSVRPSVTTRYPTKPRWDSLRAFTI